MNAKMACVMASYLKVTPLYLLVFPGMISRILFPNKVACNQPDICMKLCGNRGGCSNIAYPLLVLEVPPPPAPPHPPTPFLSLRLSFGSPLHPSPYFCN